MEKASIDFFTIMHLSFYFVDGQSQRAAAAVELQCESTGPLGLWPLPLQCHFPLAKKVEMIFKKKDLVLGRAAELEYKTC